MVTVTSTPCGRLSPCVLLSCLQCWSAAEPTMRQQRRSIGFERAEKGIKLTNIQLDTHSFGPALIVCGTRTQRANTTSTRNKVDIISPIARKRHPWRKHRGVRHGLHLNEHWKHTHGVIKMSRSFITALLLAVMALLLCQSTHARTAPVPAAAGAAGLTRKAAASKTAAAPAQSRTTSCPSPGYEVAPSGQGCGGSSNCCMLCAVTRQQYTRQQYIVHHHQACCWVAVLSSCLNQAYNAQHAAQINNACVCQALCPPQAIVATGNPGCAGQCCHSPGPAHTRALLVQRFFLAVCAFLNSVCTRLWQLCAQLDRRCNLPNATARLQSVHTWGRKHRLPLLCMPCKLPSGAAENRRVTCRCSGNDANAFGLIQAAGVAFLCCCAFARTTLSACVYT
jgi:hypothetical protein